MRWRQPAELGIRGQVSKFQGVFVIDIDPMLDDDDFFSTFLHEVAHIVLHGDAIVNSATALVASRSVLKDETYLPNNQKIEVEAENLACYWEGLARDHVVYLTPWRMLEALIEIGEM